MTTSTLKTNAPQGVLTNKILIATPQIDDPLFGQSVVYIFNHNEDGASGFILNKPTTVPITELCAKVNHQMAQHNFVDPNFVLAGGPINPETGFVVHSKAPQYFGHTHKINDNRFMTISTDVIESFGGPKAPEKYFIALGISFWHGGQLEDEVRRNDWLVIPENDALLFDVPYEKRWETALAQLNITPEMLATQGGEC